MIINKSLRAKMSLQDGANVKIVEKITRINAKMCGFLWRYSTRHLGIASCSYYNNRSDHVWVNISDFFDDRFILKRTLPSFTWCHSFFIKKIFNLPAKQVKKHIIQFAHLDNSMKLSR